MKAYDNKGWPITIDQYDGIIEAITALTAKQDAQRESLDRLAKAHAMIAQEAMRASKAQHEALIGALSSLTAAVGALEMPEAESYADQLDALTRAVERLAEAEAKDTKEEKPVYQFNIERDRKGLLKNITAQAN